MPKKKASQQNTASDTTRATIRIGWNEFITNKNSMLDDFEKAKKQSIHRPTQTDKGKVAEAAMREWLTQFLPKKYAVTSGYIISQGIQFGNKLLHYDVIVYDALNAPILWVEKNADNSEQGKVRAIPAENVCCVLEVKSTFNKRSCQEAKSKLWELAPLLEKIDDPNEPYKQFLPPNFCMGTVFFEILGKDKTNIQILNELIPEKFTEDLRGYFGGIILQAEGRDREFTGKISFLISETTIPPIFGDLTRTAIAGNFKTQEDKYFSAMIIWNTGAFATFAHDLIAIMEGKYRNGFVSSFHGLPLPVRTP